MRHCFSARQRAHTASVDVCSEQYLVTVLYFTETNEGLVSSGGSELPRHEFCFMALLVITVKCFVRRHIGGWSVSSWHGVQFVYIVCYKMIGCVKWAHQLQTVQASILLFSSISWKLVTAAPCAIMRSLVKMKESIHIAFDFFFFPPDK